VEGLLVREGTSWDSRREGAMTMKKKIHFNLIDINELG